MILLIVIKIIQQIINCDIQKQMIFKLLILAILLGIALFILKFILKPLYFIYKYTKNKAIHKLKFIPVTGPFASLEKDFKQYGDCFYWSKKSHEVFPHARAIAFNIADRAALTILDPDLIRDYFVNKQNKYVKYKLTYKNKARVFGNGVAFAQGNEWKRRRAITTSLMHFEFFEAILPKLRETTNKLLSQLEFKDGNSKFDALDFCSKIAGETIVKCFFGTDLHNTKFYGEPISPALSKFISQVGELDKELLLFLFGPKVMDLGLTQNHRNINKKIAEIRTFGKEIVDSKIKSAQTDTDMNFIKYIKEKGFLDSQKQLHLTTDELLDEFFTFFVGGMDTTAHLLHMCFYYLSIYPQIQERLREQTKNIDPNASIPQINKLVFMDYFINEVNRHYGFMSSFFPRQAIEDHMLGDIQIYKGTLLMMGWLSNYYNSDYFQKSSVFDPDRWSKPLQSPYIFTPFSAGKRTCIGKNLALIQMKLVLIIILKNHRLSTDSDKNLRLTFRSLYEPYDKIMVTATKI